MVYVPTRGEVPVRLGPDVPNTPGYGPSKMSSAPYVDPVQFELERERVLNTSWLLVGRSEQVKDPGDWISFESHGETAVVTRQPDGSLAGFHNVCRHRGPSFVTEWQGCGARRFTCPYHGWVYDTKGNLVGVPEKQDFDPAHLEGTSAPAVAVQEWGGWIYAHLAGPEPEVSLLDWIGPDIAADLGRYRMEDMVLTDVLEWDVPVSYKAIVDGFNEIYHAPSLHGSGAAWAKSARDTTFHVVNDHNYMCFVPRHQHRDALAENWDHHQAGDSCTFEPVDTVFNCNPEHIQVFNPIPIDVDRTRFLCWELQYPTDPDNADDAAYRARVDEHWEHLKVVVGEDIDIYQQLKRTKRSSAYTEHILNDREFKLAHYHEKIAEMIKDRPGG